MLQVSHLSKVYKTKGGTPTRALNDVSVNFPEKGMVFLLGKSGSGKSTLLNVCGGLDSPTSGEIIVKGRSSRDFTQSDFDSYRNTFVGFIFQEYNILDEFTVEENIALALELQGKPKDKQAIASLLEQVDLTGFAKRKPNTLSGGQKQRIAIARALIKNPEIIMADEPTGALDSATGKQVFDTLKKLSRDKLVIIVSHDRDFAEIYADRIIELKDGDIISDVTKTEEKNQAISENITVAGDALCIKKGAELSERDFAAIKSFISTAQSDAVIARGEKEVASFKKANRLTNDGGREVFTATIDKESTKTYTPEESKFIRSKLPARHAIKIGSSGLKVKPFRLFFTILLSAISFVMFGLLSTMMLYDKEASYKKSLVNSDYVSLQLKKQYLQTTTYSYSYGDGEDMDTYTNEQDLSTFFTPADVAEWGEKIDGAFGAYAIDTTSTIANAGEQKGKYYVTEIDYIAAKPSGSYWASRLLYGEWPKDTGREICISSYQADALLSAGLYLPDDGQTAYTLSDRKSLIGKQIVLRYFAETPFTISGIYDCGEVSSKYDSIKSGETTGTSEFYKLYTSFSQDLTSGMYQLSFVGKDIEEMYKQANDSLVDFRSVFHSVLNYSAEGYPYSATSYMAPYTTESYHYTALFFDEGKTGLSETNGRGEGLLSQVDFTSLLNYAFQTKYYSFSTADEEKQEELEREYNGGDVYDEETDTWSEVTGLKNKIDDFLAYYPYNSDDNDRREWTAEETRAWLDEVSAFIQKWGLNLNITIGGSETEAGLSVDFKGIFVRNDSGVYLDESSYQKAKTLLAKDSSYTQVETKYLFPTDATYTAIFLPYDKSTSVTNTVINAIDTYAADDSVIRLNCPIGDTLVLADSLVRSMSKIFLWTGIILAVFAALLLCNFISVSISYKKKEIGILRAVGARGIDVFKIFFSESLIIAAICVVLASIGTALVCNVLNAEMGDAISGVSLFVFRPLSLLMLIGIAILTAAIATFLPVWNAARRKPVESIRSL